jgi:hypothetical protein
MPDWYINAARALPPWNFAFQFPDPPSGQRGDLLGTSGIQVAVGAVVAAGAAAFAIWGRAWVGRLEARGGRAGGRPHDEFGVPSVHPRREDPSVDPEA